MGLGRLVVVHPDKEQVTRIRRQGIEVTLLPYLRDCAFRTAVPLELDYHRGNARHEGDEHDISKASVASDLPEKLRFSHIGSRFLYNRVLVEGVYIRKIYRRLQGRLRKFRANPPPLTGVSSDPPPSCRA